MRWRGFIRMAPLPTKLGEKFEGDVRLQFHLAPPLLARRDKVTGHLQKKEYGGWMIHAFRLLARLKFLRGTALDIVRLHRGAEGRAQLIDDYEAMLRQRMAALQSRDLPTLIRLARIPETIRGYGYHQGREHPESITATRTSSRRSG